MRTGIGFGIGPLRFYQPLSGRRRRRATPRPTQAQLRGQAEAQKAKEQRLAKIALLQDRIKHHLARAEYFKDSPVLAQGHYDKANQWAAMLDREERALRSDENARLIAHVLLLIFGFLFVLMVLVSVLS